MNTNKWKDKQIECFKRYLETFNTDSLKYKKIYTNIEKLQK